MEPTIDAAFIRRAVELAEPDAVRMALYHNSGDPGIGQLPVAARMNDAQRGLLTERAIAWLEANAGPDELPEPPDHELRRLLTMATGGEMGDLEFAARRDLPSFKRYPWYAQWSGDRPQLPEGFRVAIIGSGFCGLAMAVQLELLGIPYVVVDRQPEPGGTWTINRYPGIRVDTMSITYELSFERNYPWTEYFAQGPEVRRYLDHISRSYGVREHTRFEHDLRRATFDEVRDLWLLECQTPSGAQTIEANVIVNAVGTFNNPRQPEFPGTDEFEGPIVHPAQWPADLDLRGKRVAVIGNGSTGTQLVATIAEDAEQLFVFQRTAQWISPRAKYGQPVEPEIRWLLDNFPGYWNWWRYVALSANFDTHDLLIPDEQWKAIGGNVNATNDKLREGLIAYIHAETRGRRDLIDKLVPDHAPFSRRLVIDNGWYRALTRDNVELVTEQIARLGPKGIETIDGRVIEVDVIVTATGFEVSKYLWPQEYIGIGGVSIHDFWSKDGPRAYLGMTTPNFPNMFMLYGPNSQPLSGGTSLPIWFVLWSAYSARCIIRMLETGKSRVEVKAEVFERYNEQLDAEAAKLLLLQDEGAPDKNYYVNRGRLQVNAPWYGPDFQRRCTEIDWDDLEIT